MKIKKLEKHSWALHNEVKEGDLIWTFNTKTKTKELKPINKIIKKMDDSFVKIIGNNYEQIVTEDHNVLMNDCSFKKAKEVVPGDILIDCVEVLDVQFYKTEKQQVWCVNTDNNTVYASKNYKEFLTGNSQAPFSNITLDFFPPKDLEDKYPIIGGQKMSFRYKDCQEEMNIFNKTLLTVLEEGDFNGSTFSYPIVTVNCTEDFFTKMNPEVEELLYRMTDKFGTPYFANYIGCETQNPSEIRSMCCLHPETIIEVELEEDLVECEGQFYTMEEAKTNNIL